MEMWQELLILWAALAVAFTAGIFLGRILKCNEKNAGDLMVTIQNGEPSDIYLRLNQPVEELMKMETAKLSVKKIRE